jgi:hypothetical protein
LAVNYLPLLEPILNEVTDSQRAERVVALYFCVRIGVRGGAKRASLLANARTQNKEISLPSYFRRRGAGRSRQKIERIFLCFWIAAVSPLNCKTLQIQYY